MRSALLAGGLLAFALSFDEVIVTIFTAGAQQTLPIWMFTNFGRPRELPIVNVVALFVILASIIPVWIAQRISSDGPRRCRGSPNSRALGMGDDGRGVGDGARDPGDGHRLGSSSAQLPQRVGKGEGSLVLLQWPGYSHASFAGDYERETGCKITTSGRGLLCRHGRAHEARAVRPRLGIG